MNGRFGASITIADLNTDGLNDLVVSAPYVGALDLTYQVLQAMLLQYSWGFGILGSTQPCCWPLKKNLENVQICGLHFISGKSLYLLWAGNWHYFSGATNNHIL